MWRPTEHGCKRLTAMQATGALELPVGAAYPLGSAKEAFAHVLRGSGGHAIVVSPGPRTGRR